MTIRSGTSGALYGPSYKSWSQNGADGKYEIVNGIKRLKFNNYTAYYVSQTGTKSTKNEFIACGGPNLSKVFSNNELLRLQSKLSESIKGHSFNLAVSVAEGKQTVDMVVSALQTIGGTVLDLKRGKFESAARRLGVNQGRSSLSKHDVAGRWLELQYGWLPLLGDVYEATKAYEVLTKPPRVDVVEVSTKMTDSYDGSQSPSNWYGNGTYVAYQKLFYEMTEVQLSKPRSLGLTNPASVIWELIPYSFVVDWFIPIGSYFETLNTIPQLTGRFITTKFCRSQCLGLGKNKFPFVHIGASCRYNEVYVNRTVSSTLSVPRPQFVSVAEAMSPKRIWNSIALATQRFR